tara:strand:+ start:1922 stop:2320 length:399 start_codon:yes stop_codon:yes gene_type:complete
VKNSRYLSRFLVVGLTSTALNYIVAMLLFYALNIWITLSTIIGYLAGLSLGFYLNKTWTFEDTSKNNFKLILKYFFVYGISLFFAVLTVNFTIIIFNLPEYIAVIMSIIVSTILNYLGLRNWVFSETYDSKR